MNWKFIRKPLVKFFAGFSALVALITGLFQIFDVNLPSLLDDRFGNKYEAVSPYTLSVSKKGKFVELSGHFPNKQAEKIIIEDLENQELRIVKSQTKLAVGEPKDYIQVLSTVIQLLHHFDDAEINLTGKYISISGGSLSWPSYYKVIDLFTRDMPDEFEGDVQSVLQPYPCQNKLDTVIKMGSLKFASNKFEIRGQGSYELLDEIAKIVKDCGEVRLKIITYSVKDEFKTYEHRLSEVRFDVVAKYLRSLDIGKATIQRVSVEGAKADLKPSVEFTTQK